MYMKDKTEILKVRVSKKEMEYLNNLAQTMGISKSKIIRDYVNRLIGSSQIANRETNQ